MKKFLLNSYFWPMFFIITIIWLLLVPLFFLVNVVFLKRTADFTTRLGICWYGWILVKIIPFFAPLKIESRTGDLPLPVIMVANHSSAIDPYLYGALLKDASFFSTWAFKIPVYGFFMRLAKYVNPNEGWEKVSRQSIELLKSGTSLIIWPEGHRSRDGNIGRFKNGAFVLAVETGYPLLPICILGSGKFLKPGSLILSPHRIKMVLLDPVYPNPQNDRQQEIVRLKNKVHEAIRTTLQELEAAELTKINNSSKGFYRGETC